MARYLDTSSSSPLYLCHDCANKNSYNTSKVVSYADHVRTTHIDKHNKHHFDSA